MQLNTAPNFDRQKGALSEPAAREMSNYETDYQQNDMGELLRC